MQEEEHSWTEELSYVVCFRVRGGEVDQVKVKMCGLRRLRTSFVEADSYCDCLTGWCFLCWPVG